MKKLRKVALICALITSSTFLSQGASAIQWDIRGVNAGSSTIWSGTLDEAKGQIKVEKFGPDAKRSIQTQAAITHQGNELILNFNYDPPSTPQTLCNFTFKRITPTDQPAVYKGDYVCGNSFQGTARLAS